MTGAGAFSERPRLLPILPVNVMRKLCLRGEELRVESFPTVVPTANERGTVRANDSEEPISSYCWTDPAAGSTCQPAFTCPGCAPMESRDGPC